MAETLSIRERIEVQRVADVTAITGIGTVERWDARGNVRTNLSCVVIAGDEAWAEGAQGNPGTYSIRLPVRYELLIKQAKNDSESSSKALVRWLARIVNALSDNPMVLETSGGAQLAVDSRITATMLPDPEPDQAELFAIVEEEIVYEINRDDPYTGRFAE